MSYKKITEIRTTGVGMFELDNFLDDLKKQILFEINQVNSVLYDLNDLKIKVSVKVKEV